MFDFNKKSISLVSLDHIAQNLVDSAIVRPDDVIVLQCATVESSKLLNITRCATVVMYLANQSVPLGNYCTLGCSLVQQLRNVLFERELLWMKRP